jgi:hypothetical protein
MLGVLVRTRIGVSLASRPISFSLVTFGRLTVERIDVDDLRFCFHIKAVAWNSARIDVVDASGCFARKTMSALQRISFSGRA